MISSQHPIQLEGTWEDILRRGGELAGLRVRVTVLPQQPASSSPAALEPRLDQILAPLIEQARHVRKDTSPAKLNGCSEEFSQAVVEKLRRQGIKS